MTPVLYTMPTCGGCEKVKKLLKRWEIKYEEQSLKLWQNLHPGKCWQAPILDMPDNTYYEWHEIDTMEKLYAILVHRNESNTQKTTTKTKKLRINKIRSNKDGYQLTLEGMARINTTVLRAINGISLYDIMKSWSEKEKEAATIVWRLAQHNKAREMLLFAEMMQNKAITADPCMRELDGKSTETGPMGIMEE